jgi:hypothetical protein
MVGEERHPVVEEVGRPVTAVFSGYSFANATSLRQFVRHTWRAPGRLLTAQATI